MTKAKFEDGFEQVVADGLTQWDYGQVLCVEGMHDVKQVEIHFSCCGEEKALIIDAEITNGNIAGKIPDQLLEKGEDIQAYIYVTDEHSGKTVYTVVIPVKRRKKPQDYSEPESADRLKEIINKLNKKADNIEYKDGYMQLLSDTVPIGDRVRISGVGSDAREIELKNDGTTIKWRYTDSNDWTELIKLEDLRGKDGQTPEFEIREGHLFAIYEN